MTQSVDYLRSNRQPHPDRVNLSTFDTTAFHQERLMSRLIVHTTGIDNDVAERGMANIGAFILGRNMFGPIRGPWPDDSWRGWWGNNPPYHTPTCRPGPRAIRSRRQRRSAARRCRHDSAVSRGQPGRRDAHRGVALPSRHRGTPVRWPRPSRPWIRQGQVHVRREGHALLHHARLTALNGTSGLPRGQRSSVIIPVPNPSATAFRVPAG